MLELVSVVGPALTTEGEPEPALEAFSGDLPFHAETMLRTLLRGVRGRSVSEDAWKVLRDKAVGGTDGERYDEPPSVYERECV